MTAAVFAHWAVNIGLCAIVAVMLFGIVSAIRRNNIDEKIVGLMMFAAVALFTLWFIN